MINSHHASEMRIFNESGMGLRQKDTQSRYIGEDASKSAINKLLPNQLQAQKKQSISGVIE